MNDAQVYAGAAVMGAVAGMRSMSAPAVVSQLSNSGLIPEDGSPLMWLHHPGVSKVLTVLATGELIADKLPFIPARTKAGPLAARALTGGLSGAAVFSSKRRPWWIGALIGAAAAVGASFGAYKLRKQITEEYHVPDTVVAIAEDALVAGCGYLVLSSLRRKS
ncbi:MAG TPA: DUF4126 family protein [Bryobacteraceae bacterium]|nr:DUF4126 family protein [Bryobacteraceae bacterium]